MTKRILTMLPLAVVMTGCVATAAALGWPAVDTNDDDMVSRAELGEFFDTTDTFAGYDDDDDQVLSQEEYREAVSGAVEGDAYFRGYDRDANGSLTSTEFTDGLYGTFDADSSGMLSEGEYAALIGALQVEV